MGGRVREREVESRRINTQQQRKEISNKTKAREGGREKHKGGISRTIKPTTLLIRRAAKVNI